MDISHLIKRVARGKNGSEHLTQGEAKTVFAQLLSPDADDLQLGAFLIAQRMKGETSDELAGFVEAARQNISEFGTVAAPKGTVDLPCYAGKRRAGFAYLAAALKARDSGIPILIHGVESIEERVTAWQVLEQAGVKRVSSLAEAVEMLASDGVAYIDLSDLCPDLFRIYNLRSRLGVRCFSNTVARLLNPLQCEGQLNGFFHTPYADYMARANQLLGQKRSLIFMGAEGEPELYADRQKVIAKQQGGTLVRVAYDEAGLEPYPRVSMDATMLFKQSLSMLDGVMGDRERSVVQRMGQAFGWASTGKGMSDWREVS